MESYVFEKGLLTEEDLRMYCHLNDKFDFEYIEHIINQCQERLSEMLDSDDLFNISIYFKIKKYDSNRNDVKYRPLHTASLIDQICMVAMLLPLMFEDGRDNRERSELTKIIPDSFYGNIPSTEMESLFVHWTKQYSNYTNQIIEHSSEYKTTHSYKTEISLDLENFFPSINPAFIYNFILDKLSYRYTSKDRETLKTVLKKLLFFTIKEDSFKNWEEQYYTFKDNVASKDLPQSVRMVQGIAQGLPQSYFFGNLCMIEVLNKIMSIPDFENSKPFFYVDDSVIYIKKDYTQDIFNETIAKLNNEVAKIGANCSIYDINPNYAKFHDILNYKIKFHKAGKSEFCRIEDVQYSVAGLLSLSRETSMANAVYSNLDETEDRYSLEKLSKILILVDDEIKRISNLKSNPNEKDHISARLKLLKRYKRFYLYRIKLLELKLNENIEITAIKIFIENFEIPFIIAETYFPHLNLSNKHSITNVNFDRESWLDKFEESIFQNEAHLLISQLNEESAIQFKNLLLEFEKFICDPTNSHSGGLYFAKIFEAALKLKKYLINPYHSLSKWMKENFTGFISSSPFKQKNRFESIVDTINGFRNGKRTNLESHGLNKFFNDYTFMVLKNSDEYSRIFLNAMYSFLNEIQPSEALSFTKYSPRPIHYTELRILCRLRNKNFNLKNFTLAISEIDARDLDNRMNIDMGLLEVVGTFIKKVRNPNWVDSIILTHRVVKGLWYNGSKFMNSYTLHNEEHAVTLIKSSVRLIKAIDYLAIKQVDYYILFLACYLHDISMVIHPNLDRFCDGSHSPQVMIEDFIKRVTNTLNEKRFEPNNGTKKFLLKKEIPASNEAYFKKWGHLMIDEFNIIYDFYANQIRSKHAFESATMIKAWNNSVLKYLEKFIINHVAKVSESHGYDAEDVYGLKSNAKDSLISEKYLMMLMRLSDLLDVANERINYNLLRQNVSHMAPVSQFHWISHLITDEIEIHPTFEIDSGKRINVHGEEVDKSIEERRITENLNFNLFMNVKFLSTIKSPCKKCRKEEVFPNELINVPLEYDDNLEGISLRMNKDLSYDKVNGQSIDCPLICKWAMIKHEWFIYELEKLNFYLNTVNDRWFDSIIRFNLLFRDEYHLESDLYDMVQEYLKDKKVSFE
jgi:hypothetical protein